MESQEANRRYGSPCKGTSPDCKEFVRSDSRTGYCRPCFDLEVAEGRYEVPKTGGRPTKEAVAKKRKEEAAKLPEVSMADRLIEEIIELKDFLMTAIKQQGVDFSDPNVRFTIEQIRKLSASAFEIQAAERKVQLAEREKQLKSEMHNESSMQELQIEIYLAITDENRLEQLKGSLEHSLGDKIVSALVERERRAGNAPIPWEEDGVRSADSLTDEEWDAYDEDDD